MSGSVSLDVTGAKPIQRIVDSVASDRRPPECPDPGPIARDALKLGDARATLADKIQAAFDKRAKAQRVITAKLAQMYVGWNPKTDAAYQQAVKDRLAADCDIDRYRSVAPDLVRLQEQARTWGKTFSGMVGQAWDAFKSIWHQGPMGIPIPFIKTTKSNVMIA